MHVAMVIDDERLDSEWAMLNRLSVGLIGEGVKLTRLVPEGADADSEWEKAIALAERMEYQAKVVPWMQKQRCERAVERFEKNPPDVIYAVGVGTWKFARDLSVAMEKPLAIDVWSYRHISHLPRTSHDWGPAAYIASTEPIGAILRQKVKRDLVAVVPFGATVPRVPNTVLQQRDEIISLAVIGPTHDIKAFKPLIAAIAELSLSYPQLKVFLELSGPREHSVWRLIRGHNLLDCVSTIIKAQMHRQLLTHCDFAILAEVYGETRTLVLDMMAAGIPVVSVEDPYLDYLVANKTASLVKGGSRKSWKKAIYKLISQPMYAQELGSNARKLVKENHRSSEQTERLFKVLERVVSGDSYKLETAVLR